MKLVYPAIFTPSSDGFGGYFVEFPDLPGCVTQGHYLNEAVRMAEDAASGWIYNELMSGNSFPKPSGYEEVRKDGSLVNMMLLDIDMYILRYGGHNVKMEVEIPAWQKSYVEKNHINCSTLLKSTLYEMAARDLEED